MKKSPFTIKSFLYQWLNFLNFQSDKYCFRFLPIAVMSLLIIFYSGISLKAQDPSLSCVSGCTSKDIKIQTAYLVDPDTGEPLSSTVPCTFGQTVMVRLALELTTNTPRIGVYIFANIRNNTTNAIIADVSECFSTPLASTGVTKVVFSEIISWNCGTPIQLSDVYIGWGTGNTDFCEGSSAPRCPATKSKCFSLPPGEYIPVITYPCTPAGITASPSNSTVCVSSSTSFTVSFTAASNTQVTQLKWQVDKNDGNGFVDFSNTTSPYSLSSLTLPATSGTSTLTINPLSNGLNGYKYRAFLQSTSTSGQNCTTTSSSATLTVNPISAGGAVASNQTVCAGTQPSGDLTLSGNTGSVLRWEKSTDAAFTSPTTISNTSTTLLASAIGNLTQDAWYRAVVQSGNCASANSGSVKISVDAVSVGGSVAAAQTICYNTSPNSLNLTGNTGNVVRWEKSTDQNFTSPTTIVSTSTTLSSATIGNLTADTWYRAIVQSGVCASAPSSSVKITVDPASSGGTVAAAQTICFNTSPNSLNLTGNTGNVVRWEKSANSSFSSPTTIASTSTTLLGTTIGNLTTDTWFRAIVQNGVCGEAPSNSVKITVDLASVGGTVASAQSVCSGFQPASDLTLSGNTGSVLRWEKSIDAAFTTPITIANTTTTLTAAAIGPLTQDTWYRAVVRNGTVCPSANSSAVKMTVNAIPSAPSVTYNAPACDATTFSVTVTGVISGATYTIKDKDGINIAGVQPGNMVVAPNTSDIIFSNIPAGKGYQVAVSILGCGSSSTTCGTPAPQLNNNLNTEIARMAPVVGSSENELGVKAYPNPFNNQVKFVINNPAGGYGTLEIMNMLGQKVKTVYAGQMAAGTQNFEMNLPTGNNGTYFYILRVGDKQATGKLIQSSAK